MPYDLSVDDSFYILPGELYDGADYPHGARPYSVLGAVRAIDDSTWDAIARDLFGLDNGDYLGVEELLTKIRETNTCSTLSAPTEVWIDSRGDYTVIVYDADGRPVS